MKKNDIGAIIWLSTLLISFLTLLLLFKFKDDNILSSLGTTGDFIGGYIGTIISLFATYLIYSTYANQKKELKLQRNLIAQQQLETTFFNMLEVHRSIKNNLSIEIKDLITKPFKIIYTSENLAFSTGKLDDFGNINGKLAFQKLLEDFERLYKHFPANGWEYEINSEIDKIITNGGYGLLDKNSVLENSSSKISQIKTIKFKYDIFHAQHFNLVGDYLRNVYHILKFLSDKKRDFSLNKININVENYADIFQSQMSYMELALIFYNGFKFRKARKLIKEFNFIENVHQSNLLINKFKIPSLGKVKSK